MSTDRSFTRYHTSSPSRSPPNSSNSNSSSTSEIGELSTLNHAQLMVILENKDRDLALAAQIGRSLLEQNRDLQTKNEFLEESVNRNLDSIVQLKHELNQRIELLRVYSNLDDDGVPRSNSDETLRERLKSTKSENERLKRECESLRQETLVYAKFEKKNTKELERQLDDANDKICGLQRQIETKTLELNSQYEKTGKLVNELSDREKKERTATMEKDEMSAILIEMIQRHDTMHGELKVMQDQYAELMANFAETESELTRFRQCGGSLRMSYDSLYDSLASEMENSESGIGGGERVHHFSPASKSGLLGTPRDSYADKDSGFEANLSLAAEMELVSQQILEKPVTVEIPTITEPIFSKQHTASIFCDASTSCTDIFVKTEELSIVDEDCRSDTPSVSGVNASRDGSETPSFRNVEASTPIIVRKFPGITTSPTKSIYTNMQRTPIGSRLSRKPSQESLEPCYDEPKLGQPGMPGTRDLDVSLKIIKAREEVQREFDAYCTRKGLDKTQFFGKDTKRCQSSNDSSWTDFSSFFGIRMIQSMLPNRVEEVSSLSISNPNPNRQGVLTRTEVQSSSGSIVNSPMHRPSLTLSLSSVPSLKLGATHGVLQRR